jgi:hypothetical protein
LIQEYDEKEYGMVRAYPKSDDKRQLSEDLMKLRKERFMKIREYMKGLENQPVKK